MTSDEYVAKGEGRPVFLKPLGPSRSPPWAIRLLRPHYYVRGQACAIPSRRSERLQAAIDTPHEVEGEMRFTCEAVFSSTTLLTAYFCR